MSTNKEGTSGDNRSHECAAGAFCTAPPGTDVNASAHRCLDCQRKIHCALWCGENWGEYIESGRCKITPDRLSAAGTIDRRSFEIFIFLDSTVTARVKAVAVVVAVSVMVVAMTAVLMLTH